MGEQERVVWGGADPVQKFGFEPGVFKELKEGPHGGNKVMWWAVGLGVSAEVEK